MYQRTYPQSEGIPPNYKGNAFDNLKSAEEAKEEAAPKPPILCDDPCEKCEKHEKTEKEEKGLLSSILSRRDGSSFSLDDIILGGLIILLLNSHADDELLLILVLLFISGI